MINSLRETFATQDRSCIVFRLYIGGISNVEILFNLDFYRLLNLRTLKFIIYNQNFT